MDAALRKRLLSIISPAVVIMILSIIIVAGCTTEKNKSIIYNAEKLYHDAEKLRQKSNVKPDTDRTEIYNLLKDAYNKTTDFCLQNIDSFPIEKFPDDRKTLESIAFKATNRMVQLYSAEKKFDSVIFVTSRLMHFTRLEDIELLTTQFNLARAYQSKGNLPDAIHIYHSLLDSFYPPVTDNNEIITMVLNLPLQIIKTYYAVGEDSLAALEGIVAEEYYNRLVEDWPNSDLETAAIGNLARIYYDLADWDKAIEKLNLLTDSTGQIDVEAAMMKAGILINGKKQYDRAISIFDNLLDRVTDTTIIPVIMLRKGIAFYEKGEYQTCRQIMSEINDRFEYYYHNNPTPQKYVALSFERLGDWNMAENEYKWLIDNYSVTEPAFDAHLTLADHYKKLNNNELAESWYRRAETFYNTMATRYPGTVVEASAISYLAETARRRENWDLAARYLEELYSRFPNTEHGRRGLVNAATIYREKFNDENRADSLINLLKRELIPLDGGKNINDMTENK